MKEGLSGSIHHELESSIMFTTKENAEQVKVGYVFFRINN